MTESLSVEEFVNLIRGKMKLIEDCKLYYVLRKFGLRLRVGGASFTILKVILALHDVGVNEFGAIMIANLADLKYLEGCWTNLHMLGDNRVIQKLYGVEFDRSVWTLSPIFLEAWEGRNIGNVDNPICQSDR